MLGMKRRQFLFLTGVAALYPLRFGSGAAQEDGRFEQISALISAKMQEYRIPGVAFGVFKNGRIMTRGFGVTNVDDPQSITPETIFPIASISKTFAATAVMKLVEEGRVDLNAPVRKYIPDFRVHDQTATNEVTVWNLLTHTPGWEGQLNTQDRGAETLSFFTSGLRDVPQLAPPGTVWSYNNAGFGVAGRMIEVVSRRSIHDALRELVFAPLELTHAFTRTGDVMTYRFAPPHRQRQDNRTEVIRPFTPSLNITAGGILTTVSDLLRYARFHLGNGTTEEGKQFLPAAMFQQMRTPQLRKNSTDDEMGIGWQLRRVIGIGTAAHGGTLAGHCLHLQLVPERNMAFSILTNHADGWRLIQDAERAILKTYEGMVLAPNQAIAHRGVNEAMTAHATPLATQPIVEPYIGVYQRPPLGTVQVRVEQGRLMAKGNGVGPDDTSMIFYGPDIAYATTGSYTGMPFEFIRTPDGNIGWIRINGRIAKKES
jgi:CubicO group peptidase (beta-lactamase class C family)